MLRRNFEYLEYCNNPKYWDRQAFVNSVDPDQMPQYATLFAIHTAIFQTHQEVVEWTISNFRTSMVSR